MARSTPHVDGTVLVDQGHATSNIAVGSPAWYAWLEDATTFAFTSAQGSFTARKGRRGQRGWYWKAYRKHKGSLHRAYLGKSADLSLDRLTAIAGDLARRAAEPPPLESPSVVGPAQTASDLPGDFLPLRSAVLAVPAPRSQLLPTKLYLPRARPDLVARPRLFARLDAGLHGVLTLICAPAGFGKTTLLAEWLHRNMGLPLSPDDAAALEARTEGWIAGLQFAALAMQDRDDYAGFIAAFTGSNRFIMDYLADEVLSRQPAHIQTFLLQTAILDRMCGPLCDAVLGVGDQGSGIRSVLLPPHPRPLTPDVYSQLLLEHLERANLFVTPLDDERRWYRYHHLFGEVLRERLQRGAATAEVATLHRRASAWYEQHNLLPEAVQHALAAGEAPLAARLIEALGRPVQLRGEMTTMLGWFAALPPDVVRTRPHLGVSYAWGLATTGQVLAAERWLQDVEHSLDNPGWGPTTILAELRSDPAWCEPPLPSRSRSAARLNHAKLTRRSSRHSDPAPSKPTTETHPHDQWALDA